MGTRARPPSPRGSPKLPFSLCCFVQDDPRIYCPLLARPSPCFTMYLHRIILSNRRWLHACTSSCPSLPLHPVCFSLVPCCTCLMHWLCGSCHYLPGTARFMVLTTDYSRRLLRMLTMHNCWGEISLRSYDHPCFQPLVWPALVGIERHSALPCSTITAAFHSTIAPDRGPRAKIWRVANVRYDAVVGKDNLVEEDPNGP
jgi:hypothetical protein